MDSTIKSTFSFAVKHSHAAHAFTWTELIFLIFVVGVFATVVWIYLGNQRNTARSLTLQGHYLRQIGQASLIYANENGNLLPGLHLTQDGEIDPGATTPNIHAIAAALARDGGLSEAHVWFVSWDPHPDVIPIDSGPVLFRGEPHRLNPDFARTGLSYQYVAGLHMTDHPSNMPVAVTRGLKLNGSWDSGNISPFGETGGHVLYLGGNVVFYKDLGRVAEEGILTSRNGERTNNIFNAIPATARIFSEPGSETGSPSGTTPVEARRNNR